MSRGQAIAHYFSNAIQFLTNNSDALEEMERMGYPSQKLMAILNLTEEDIAIILNMSQMHARVRNLTEPTVVEEVPPCYWLRDATTSYRHLHGYIALLVCVFGTIANILNVVVLTRKEMAAAPINRILTGIAVADMLVMLDYIPFATYMYIIRLPNEAPDFSYSGALFVLFHMHFSQLLHTISICLTLTLAIWRYLAIKFPQKSQQICSDRNCTLGILMAFSLPAVICIPSYLVFSVRSTQIREHQRLVTLYFLGLSDLARENNEFLYNVNFWVYAVVMKLLPCVILTVISYNLITVLYEVNERKQRLKGDSARPCKAERRVDRTTRMLVAVLLLFLITEVPQGILGLLSGILGRRFFKNCYHQFGEVMDILALINGAINFILYCSMSRQFRTTFGQLFKPKLLAKWVPPETEAHTTYV
ncbi:G-protein coupled receptor dmsr-1-like [Homalodisca vitripennis]|uniref:G-protein coupled receptor dmsr-1-like n=1 Tax=Homalodisca vitripennis TaxID=197043 RepID=UPI001EEA3154|nr:G-protein coupled receptor dmsr-1-like [Homalodisca vitripennis]KAG8322351.1 myosuppressin receptor activity protein [Homalodisca vitripennis]